MNAFWGSVLGSVARTAIGAASGYAVAKGTLTAQDAATATDALATVVAGQGDAAVGAAGILLTGAWSLWQKYRAR